MTETYNCGTQYSPLCGADSNCNCQRRIIIIVCDVSISKSFWEKLTVLWVIKPSNQISPSSGFWVSH